MKKDYSRPEAEIIDIITTNLIATSPGETDVPEEEPNQGLGTGKHRGDWGNIWGGEE